MQKISEQSRLKRDSKISLQLKTDWSSYFYKAKKPSMTFLCEAVSITLGV